jgi:hypothetical protein
MTILCVITKNFSSFLLALESRPCISSAQLCFKREFQYRPFAAHQKFICDCVRDSKMFSGQNAHE